MTASVGLMSAMKNTVSMTAHKICFGLRKYLLWSGVELSPVKPKAELLRLIFHYLHLALFQISPTPNKMEEQILIQKNMLST